MKSVPKEPKLRKKQTVINELAQIAAETYAAGATLQALENKKYSLKRELDRIIQEEYK